MRQALIVGARPVYTKNKPFPRVPLGSGAWEIRGENMSGTKVRLTIYTPVEVNGGTAGFPKVVEMPVPPEFYLVAGPCEISTEIIEPGRESYISVFAYAKGS